MTHGLSKDNWESDQWSEPGFDDDQVADCDGEDEYEYWPASLDEEYEDDTIAPSLPVILLSALFGLAGAVFGLYLAYDVLTLGIELSAGIATFCMLFCLGATGAAVSSLTGSRPAPINIAFSCGLILACVLFLVCCALCGAVTASLLIEI